jgi:hypothetical protein
MSETTQIVLEALVDDAERPALIVAAELLSESLGQASGGPAWSVRLGLHAPGAGLGADTGPTAVIVSLLPEVASLGEPIAETEARWRVYLGGLLAAGVPVLVCTVFRHVAGRPAAGAPSPVVERIRRLDRMVVDLSHEFGVGVIDIDRAFAHIGGRTLQTDYRLAGVLAAEVAGHAIAWSLLSFGLDEAVDPDLQEKAKAFLGGLPQIDALVGRRLTQRRAAQAARG